MENFSLESGRSQVLPNNPRTLSVRATATVPRRLLEVETQLNQQAPLVNLLVWARSRIHLAHRPSVSQRNLLLASASLHSLHLGLGNHRSPRLGLGNPHSRHQDSDKPPRLKILLAKSRKHRQHSASQHNQHRPSVNRPSQRLPLANRRL